jgi:threonine aldolase
LEEVIEFRSDTFTMPSAGMLDAMMHAQVGDDVFSEDPTVNALEEKAAVMFGMESAIFCPSGTMTNQIGIKCHTQPGDELICDKLSHVYIYEGGGVAFNSGVQVKPLEGNRGRITAEQVAQNINPDDLHKARTSLVSLENTANRGGGSCYAMNDLLAIKKVCTDHALKLHLDGARLWNALVSQKETPKQYGEIFDSISICLSKGLGAPVGSLLLGKTDYINKARRVRKVLGGGMRQAGFLAAAGLYALENNIERLAIDHQHAKMIGDTLLQKDFIASVMPVETNIIICQCTGRLTAAAFAAELAKHKIKVIAISPTDVRFVFHLDVTEKMIERTIDMITKM